MFNVSVMDHTQVIFSGSAKSVILPGDYGEFEVLDFHKPIMSLLKRGSIIVDGVSFPISKGIARFLKNDLMALVEL
jgi:F0F1-type ATP synthase epsilon subunit